MDKKEFLSDAGPVTAVRAWFATPELKRQALSRLESQRIVADLAREPSRDLLTSLCTLASGLEPMRVIDVRCFALVAALDRAVAAREILFVRGWDFAGTRPATAAAAEVSDSPTVGLARRLMAEQAEIKFEGRRYRWAGTRAAIRAAAKEGYRPVSAAESPSLLKRMAGSVPATADQRAAWAEALEQPPPKDPDRPAVGGGDRLTLLRYVTAAAQAITASTGASTPSQLNPIIADEHWIEIEIVYDDGTPFDGSCVLELPDGRVSEGAPDAGVVRIDGLMVAGTCKLRFPQLDAAAFAPG